MAEQLVIRLPDGQDYRVPVPAGAHGADMAATILADPVFSLPLDEGLYCRTSQIVTIRVEQIPEAEPEPDDPRAAFLQRALRQRDQPPKRRYIDP